MIKYLKILLKTSFIVLILIVSFTLRYKNYDQVPVVGQSVDEYSNSWVGLSLIKTGYPVGITNMKGYENNDYRYVNVDHIYQKLEGTPFNIGKPWFDHPPLMGILTGSYTYFKGAQVFEDVRLFLIRKPMVYLGTFSVLLVFLICFLNFNYFTGLIAAIVYGTTPFIVITSRMAQAENGVIPMFLLSLLFYSLFKKNKHYFYLFLSAVFAGLATLFKIPGVVSILSIIFLIYSDNKKQLKNQPDKVEEIIFFSTIAFSITSLFVIYGFIYDWTTFKNIFNTNANRYYGIGPYSIFHLLTQNKITNSKNMTDAWIITSWIPFFILMFRKKINFGEKLIIVSILSYLAIYIILGSDPFGWYTFPFLPFISIALARILYLGFNNIRYMVSSFILLLIPLGFNISHFIDIPSFQKYSNIWRFSLGFLIILFIFLKLKKLNYPKFVYLFIRLILILIFATTIYLNIKYVSSININTWYGID
ncbi:MAG: glycosyltransferase family 39 protein [Candidatus Shapirobacteria bacterium]|nr:glycosyltransferase family 39 protein [Candidatus Shapirobacteria bacterium]